MYPMMTSSSELKISKHLYAYTAFAGCLLQNVNFPDFSSSWPCNFTWVVQLHENFPLVENRGLFSILYRFQFIQVSLIKIVVYAGHTSFFSSTEPLDKYWYHLVWIFA